MEMVTELRNAEDPVYDSILKFISEAGETSSETKLQV